MISLAHGKSLDWLGSFKKAPSIKCYLCKILLSLIFVLLWTRSRWQHWKAVFVSSSKPVKTVRPARQIEILADLWLLKIWNFRGLLHSPMESLWIDLVKEAVLGNPLDKMLLLQNITFPSFSCYFGLEASGNTEKQSTLRQASRSSPPVKSSQIDRTSGILILRHRFIMF